MMPERIEIKVRSDEDILYQRINRVSNFTRAFVWLFNRWIVQGDHSPIYSSELAKFLKSDVGIAGKILKDLADLGILKYQLRQANQNAFLPIVHDKMPVFVEYMTVVKRTLGVEDDKEE